MNLNVEEVLVFSLINEIDGDDDYVELIWLVRCEFII